MNKFSKFLLQQHKVSFFLKLSLYFNTYSLGFVKVFNLKSYLFGLRSKSIVGLINPIKTLSSIYTAFYVIYNVIKFNGTILLFNEFDTNVKYIEGVLTDIPSVYSINENSVIPGFLSNQNWTRWFFWKTQIVL